MSSDEVQLPVAPGNVDIASNLTYCEDESALGELTDEQEAQLNDLKDKIATLFERTAKVIDDRLDGRISSGEISENDICAREDFRATCQEELFRDPVQTPALSQIESSKTTHGGQQKYEEFKSHPTILDVVFPNAPQDKEFDKLRTTLGQQIQNAPFDENLEQSAGWATSTVVYETNFLDDSITAQINCKYLHLIGTEKKETPPRTGLLPPSPVKYVVVDQELSQVKFQFLPDKIDAN